MFHTFQSTVTLKSSEGGSDVAKPARPAGSRRISTSNACVECRRRKIRCDGTQPCGQCQWYQHPELCGYSKPAQRVVPSRKLVDKLQQSIEQYKTVLSRLYPSKDIESLIALPREQLLDLALSIPAASSSSPEATIAQPTKSDTPSRSDGADSLEALEQAPDENPEWDEARKHQVKIQGISDDINGLSMAVDKHSSYVGVSSITTALKVIMKIAPIARSFVAQSSETALPSRANTPPPELLIDDPYYMPRWPVAQQLLESYFSKVHVFFPMIDERKFWTTFLYGERKDGPWLALINMVFAMGSLASSTTDNQEHYAYFTRSRQHLALESFGSGSLEVLQCLGIMSGWYMHYLNRPNEAHSLMGGALRMATALGLHREYVESVQQGAGSLAPTASRVPSDAVSAEMRRRIWWSLFCLDSWASTTTGRPSLGRMGPSITVQLPGRLAQSEHVFQPNSPQNREALKIVPLIYFGEFCKIATRIQDRLIEQPLLKFNELSQFDQDLVRWHEELPSILSNLEENCPDFLRVIRLVMKWRYQNLRLVLHRPTLLACCLRRVPFTALNAEDKVAVGKCRLIAGKTIEDISAECPDDLISGWNGVWFVYQACMVPLVSLFSDTSNQEEVEKWTAQIEMALLYFEKMKRYSVAAKRSQGAIAKLYEAFKAAQAQEAAQVRAQAQQEQQRHHYQQQQQGLQAMHGMLGLQTLTDPINADIGSMGIRPGIGVAGGVWADPASATGSISGFSDDMMWDTSFPDMADNDYLLGEFDFNGTVQDGSAAVGGWAYGHNMA